MTGRLNPRLHRTVRRVHRKRTRPARTQPVAVDLAALARQLAEARTGVWRERQP